MQVPPLLFFFVVFTISFNVSQAMVCRNVFGGSKLGNVIVVDKHGRGNFRTIQGAIDAIPSNNNQWIKIQINPGIYIEQVTIPYDKPCILLEGQSREVTTVTYGAHGQIDRSATFSSFSDNVVARGITFQNSFDVDWVKDYINKGPYTTQAVAALISGDKSAFIGCGFVGFQDTLWDAQGRHHFQNCYIEGAIDFVFGNGQSYYEDCLINVTSRGFITAQGRDSPNDPSGFVFKRGTVIGIDGAQTYLGRAYRKYSRVIFDQTLFAEVVVPEGWDAWNYEGQEHNFMYAEINCRGPGSNTSQRVPWVRKLDGKQANQFARESFIDRDGWLGRIP